MLTGRHFEIVGLLTGNSRPSRKLCVVTHLLPTTISQVTYRWILQSFPKVKGVPFSMLCPSFQESSSPTVQPPFSTHPFIPSLFTPL